MLSLFLRFPFAFIFTSLVAHICSSVIENVCSALRNYITLKIYFIFLWGMGCRHLKILLNADLTSQMPLDISREIFYKINSATPSGQHYLLNRMWERCCREAGIEKIRWHDLRHTFASRLVMAGVNILTVQKLCRHADVKVTMRYAHLAPQYLQEAVNKLINWTELTPEVAPTAEQSLQ